MSVVLDIALPDEFEKGDCHNCPISFLYPYGLDDVITCCPVAGRTFNNCPIVCEYNLKALGEHVAERALDGFEYKGKTLREWIKQIHDSEVTE